MSFLNNVKKVDLVQLVCDFGSGVSPEKRKTQLIKLIVEVENYTDDIARANY